MPSILIVDKSGAIKATNLKEYNEQELYKKAGSKSANGFGLCTTWNVKIQDTKYSIQIFGKTVGRAGQENKYDFPPPVDTTLFFGSCVLVNRDVDAAAGIRDLTTGEWNQIYEKLFGGFENIGEEDSDDEASEEAFSDDDTIPHTRDGYVKDGFVVDDDEEEEDEEEDDESSEEDDKDSLDDEESGNEDRRRGKVAVSKTNKKRKPKMIKICKDKAKSTSAIKEESAKKINKIIENVFVGIVPDPPAQTYLDCTSELCEEAYFA